MRPSNHQRTRQNRKLVCAVLTAAFTLTWTASTARAQSDGSPAKSSEPLTIQYFHLSNAISAYASSDIMNALRNILTPTSKVILLTSQNVIAVASTPDQIAQAKTIVHEFDQPPKRYRLTYTIIDLDGTRRIGEQHYSMVALDGQKMTLKQGSKVPVTIENSKDNSNQVTYLDIGMNFEAMVNSSGDSANLQTKVARSSLAEERSSIGPQDPIVRQSVFEGASILTMGKPVTLGSIDFPDSTRHLDIQVMAERMN